MEPELKKNHIKAWRKANPGYYRAYKDVHRESYRLYMREYMRMRRRGGKKAERATSDDERNQLSVDEEKGAEIT